MLIEFFFQFLLSLWLVNLLLWEIFQFLRFLLCCYDTILVPTAESSFLGAACPFYHLGNSFWVPFVCLLLWGFLYTILIWFILYSLGNSCSKCHWKVLCTTHALFISLLLGEFLFQCYWNTLYTVHAPFIPYRLGNSLVQYCWKVLYMLFAPYYLGSAWSNVLCAVHALFIPYCLGNFLVQCYWIALCAICALFIPYWFLGNSCSHFILERLCFLYIPFFCHFSLKPSTPFPSHCLLCVSLALSSLVLLCHLPSSVGAPSKYFFCWHNLS